MRSKRLALFGGNPVRSKPYPPYNTIGGEEKQMAIAVLETGVLSGFAARGNEQFYGGYYVRELESLFCKKFGVKYAITFNSATSALHGTMIASGIGPGDEVIVSPFSMSASASAVLMCHAVPVFVDIEPDMFCIDPAKLEAAITAHTKAIMVVNLFGLPADLNPIMEIARRYNLIVVEDNAQSPGAIYMNRFTGTIGDMGVFSLNRHKTIQCGEGGVVLTGNDNLAERLQLSRNHGEVVLLDWNRDDHSDIVGYNYRMSELHAAIAIPQLKKLDILNKERVSLANYLTHMLQDISFIRPPKVREGCTHVYYLYPMVYEQSRLGITRDTLIKALIAEGIHAAPYGSPIYMYPFFQNNHDEETKKKKFPGYDGYINYSHGICPVVEKVQAEKIVLTNICRPPNTKREIEEFITALKKIELNINELQDF